MNYKDYEYDSFAFTMTDNQYKTLIDLLEDNRPNRIIELGGGQSTRIFQNINPSIIVSFSQLNIIVNMYVKILYYSI